jgi:hypothetical protein
MSDHLHAPAYLFEYSGPTSKKSHRVLITKTNQLMLCTETDGFSLSENAEFFYYKANVIYPLLVNLL